MKCQLSLVFSSTLGIRPEYTSFKVDLGSKLTFPNISISCFKGEHAASATM